MSLIVTAVVIDIALLAGGAAALGFFGRGNRGLLDTYGWILLRRDVRDWMRRTNVQPAYLFALLLVAVAAGTAAVLA